MDKLTYAGCLRNLQDIQDEQGNGRYVFVSGDIGDGDRVSSILGEYQIDTVVHFAAESHVDRSIVAPEVFLRTNVMGTFALLEAARVAWKDRCDVLFHHVSSDEVYGSLGPIGKFTENTPYDPRSPYSASKAASDHLVNAYHNTYGLPTTLSICSNNYGPYQFPEKLIPLMILNMLEGRALPIYGDGKNVRDWIYVQDHVAGLWKIIHQGVPGNRYNLGGGNECENVQLVYQLCDIVASELSASAAELRRLVKFVTDRPGHDRRYALDCTKAGAELGWRPLHDLATGLRMTATWYLNNPEWVDAVRTGEYTRWFEVNYAQRGGA